MEQAAAPGQALKLWPSTPRSVHRARHELLANLTAWELSGLAQEAALVLSELMTNAVQYAKVPGRYVGTQFLPLPQRGVRIEVHDPSPVKPELRTAAAYDENGRGLALVDALTDHRWGVTPRSGPGKLVWAELTLPPAS